MQILNWQNLDPAARRAALARPRASQDPAVRARRRPLSLPYVHDGDAGLRR